jgi:adenylate kinase
MMRTQPNIIITGTPGTGKSTHCEQLAEKTGMHHLSINDVVKKHNIGEASDDPEDPNLQIIDWHACDLFPPSMIDLVCVIRCDNGLLYDRLKARGYAGKKLEENMDCEIMEVLLNEAREAYDGEIVVELRSEKAEDVEANVERIEQWITNWKKDHGKDDEASAQSGGKPEDDPNFLHG